MNIMKVLTDADGTLWDARKEWYGTSKRAIQ